MNGSKASNIKIGNLSISNRIGRCEVARLRFGVSVFTISKEDESEGPSQSVTNQKSLLDEFVQKHRLQVYDTYIDDGWSGTNFVEVR